MSEADVVGGTGRGFLATLRSRSASLERTLVFPEGTEARVHDTVAACVPEGVFRAVLLGAPDEVRAGLDRRGVDPDRLEIVDPTDPDRVARTLDHLRERRSGKGDSEADLVLMAKDPLMQAATMVAVGELDGAVAGCVRTTADVVRAGLTCIGLADGIRTLSSSFYMVFDEGHPVGPLVLTFTDAGVVPRPSADQLAEIAASATRARIRVVGDEPRVAFLSYSTRGSAEGDAVTEVRAGLARFLELMPDVPADGELQGDAALAPGVALRKAPGSPVAGAANVLVFPDLGAANIAYKLVQHLGGAVALGPILQGLARPFNDLSRGAVAADIVSVACITALMAE
jgi:phosphate acetyltransferase